MKILITAGPTREAIDPVRYISNRSSGKMGYAIAAAASARGHEVILVSGPVAIDSPQGISVVKVVSAGEMLTAVRDRIGAGIDAAVFCAAVADYRPVAFADRKIKKETDKRLTLELEKTEDILGTVRSGMDYQGLLVGFAAETHDLEKYARQKLVTKQCDLLVANQVGHAGTGFDAAENELRLFFADGRTQDLERQPKSVLGEKLIEIIEKLGEARA